MIENLFIEYCKNTDDYDINDDNEFREAIFDFSNDYNNGKNIIESIKIIRNNYNNGTIALIKDYITEIGEIDFIYEDLEKIYNKLSCFSIIKKLNNRKNYLRKMIL
jgi:hypothetical protein